MIQICHIFFDAIPFDVWRQERQRVSSTNMPHGLLVACVAAGSLDTLFLKKNSPELTTKNSQTTCIFHNLTLTFENSTYFCKWILHLKLQFLATWSIVHVDQQQLWQQERLPLPFAESAMTSDGRLTWIFDSEPWNLTLALASPFLLRCLLICRSNILKLKVLSFALIWVSADHCWSFINIIEVHSLLIVFFCTFNKIELLI